MPIFQPTNIIPSSLSGKRQGVSSQDENVSVSWQINGTSPLTGFKLDFYSNDVASTLVHTTNKISLNTPFYGTDNKGNPVQFSYSFDENWGSFDMTNGNSYKMIITQYWGDPEQSVQQYSPSVFVLASRPNVQITNYTAPVQNLFYQFEAQVNNLGVYSIDWCRWEFARLDDRGNYSVLDDTGEINTSILSYKCDGLITGNTYAIRCTIQSSSGQESTTGWVPFPVVYELDTNYSEVTTTPLSDSSVLLSMPNETNVEGNLTEGSYAFDNENLILSQDGRLEWSEMSSGAELSIAPPYSISFKADATGFEEILKNEIGEVGAICVYPKTGRPTRVFAACATRDFLNVYIFSVLPESANPKILSFLSVSHLKPNGRTMPAKFMDISADGTALAFASFDEVYVADIFPSQTVSNLRKLSLDSLNAVFGSARFSPATSTNKRGYLFVGAAGAENGSGFFVYKNIGKQSGEQEYQAVFSGLGSVGCDFLTTTDGSFYIAVALYGDTATEFGRIYFCSSGGDISTDYTPVLSGSIPVGASVNSLNIFFAFGYVFYNGVLTVEIEGSLFPEIIAKHYCYPFDYSQSSILGEGIAIQKITGSKIATDDQTYYISDGYSLYHFDPSTETVQLLYVIEPDPIPNPYAYIYSEANTNVVLLIPGKNGITVKRQTQAGGSIRFIGEEKSFEVSRSSVSFSLLLNGESAATEIPIAGDQVVFSFSDNRVKMFFFSDGELESQSEAQQIDGVDFNINSIVLSGYWDIGWILIQRGDYDISESDFVPTIDTRTAFYADFSEQTTDATIRLIASAVYRKEGNRTKKVLDLQNGKISRFRDYGIQSGNTYAYDVLVSPEEGSTFYIQETRNICQRFHSYYLIEASPDADDANLFHALKVWRFGNNIEAGGVTNNNTPNWLVNFTPYRLRQPTSRSGKSGVLQALLSNVSDCAYHDTVAMQERLYQASNSTNVFFLKDMKGNLYMVHISAPIVQTINTKSNVQQVTVSIPWEEIGDAKGVSIVQLPTDEGWPVNMLSQVVLDVDVETGLLSVTYPEEYFGSTFRMEQNNLMLVTGNGADEPRASISDGAVMVVSN